MQQEYGAMAIALRRRSCSEPSPPHGAILSLPSFGFVLFRFGIFPNKVRFTVACAEVYNVDQFGQDYLLAAAQGAYDVEVEPGRFRHSLT